MDLNEIVVFIKVAQLGSFIRASESLGIPKSTVSTKVSQLEKRLGVSLIHRTTRKINLTQIGQQFYERCAENIQSLKSAEEEITFLKSVPSGKIKISAPIYLGSYFLPEILKVFKKDYPKISVELVLTDRAVDLIGEGVDVAIRAGHLQDSVMISKKIGSTYFSLYASPTYLKKNPKIAHPKDLKDHHCLQFPQLGKDKWVLTNSVAKQTVSVSMSADCLVDDIGTLKSMACLGQGVALLPAFSCAENVESKQLQAVLPSWRTDVRPIHFIYPSAKFQLPKLKQFIAIAEQVIKPRLS